MYEDNVPFLGRSNTVEEYRGQSAPQAQPAVLS